MMDRAEVEPAVKLQRMGYRLLKWLEGAIDDGFITPETAHVYATLPEAAYAWIDRHYLNLPSNARPQREDLRAFSNLLSTYLDSTFDLEASPGERLYSPDAHCFCPMCSWMVRVPYLKPKKLKAAHKRRARDMMKGYLEAVATEHDVVLPNGEAARCLEDPKLREALALCAYTVDLFQRLKGHAEGPATLALWRGFAWTPEGSPKKGFELTAEAVLEAERAVVDRLRRLRGEQREE